MDFQTDPDLEGVVVELTDASPPGSTYERPPLAAATPLDDATTAGLLARLPALPDEADDQSDFSRRAETRPAPRPGVEVDLPFPPPPADVGAPDAAAGPPTVLRASPEGDVPLAPQLSITFDQPMIAVTGQDDAAAQVPVSLDPQPEGQWRWLGTRTLVFEPTVRFPMATEYTLTVPAGTPSAGGDALAAEFRQVFRTPPVQLVDKMPEGGPHDRQPIILLGFDQAIDRDAVQARLRVQVGGQAFPTRFATEAELQADPHARRMREGLDARGPSRWLAVRPDAPLPYDSTVTVTVPKGTPSAEGPRLSTADQAFSFQTYGPLELVESRCGYRDRCSPYDDIQLRFSNPIDGDAFQTSMVQVQPEIPDASIFAQGAWLTVSGLKQPLTTYTITVSGDLLDGYGQTLGDAVVVKKKTGAAEPASPMLMVPGPDLRTLDPQGRPVLSLYTVALDQVRLRVHRVGPGDWADYVKWRQHRGWYRDDDPLPAAPGAQLADRKLSISRSGDQMVETVVDLSEWLEDGPGQLLVWLEADTGNRRRGRQSAVTWVQRTDIGLTALTDPSRLLTWATDLSTGAPLDDVTVTLQPTGTTATTAGDGLASLPLASGNDGPQLLVAQRGDDVSIYAPAGLSDHAAWQSWDPGRTTAWFVFDDRHLYKPKESVRVKGWLRVIDNRVHGDVAGLDSVEGPPKQVDWVLRDARNAELGRGSAPITGLGGFDLELTLPDDMNLGTASVQLIAEGKTLGRAGTTHHFEVQEFRRPEYEVRTTLPPGPFVLGEAAVASVSAAYYAGGGLPGAEVSWTVQPSWSTYTPPNQGDWAFGQWIPWWASSWWWPQPEPWLEGPPALQGSTDALGNHYASIRLSAVGQPRPVQLEAQAVVTDVNRQAWASSATLLVHPSSVYVGLRTARPYYDAGKPIDVQAIVVDIDGRPVAGRPVELRWWTTRWSRDKQGNWLEEEVQVQTCSKVSLGRAGTDAFKADPVSCTFKADGGGRFTARATVVDDAGRSNQTEVAVWVSGDQGDRPRDRSVQKEQAILIPDKDSYRPGDVAEILVQSPFPDAQGLLTIQRSGLEEAIPFQVQGDSAVVEVPIKDGHVPDVHVAVELVGSASRPDDDGAERGDLPARPAFAGGSLQLKVPPLSRTLSVSVTPGVDALEPGGSTDLTVAVVDDQGRPVSGAELAVVVVDEAVLALTGYRIPDPLDTFYALRDGGVRDEHARYMLWLDDPAALGGLGAAGSGPGGGGMEGAATGDMMMAADAAMPMEMAPSAPMAEMAKSELRSAAAEPAAPSGPAIAVRTDFRALALFLPAERTRGDGSVVVPLTLPDNLTRYRVTVVAVQGGQRFGSAEATVTARMPLMLRPSAPRFLNFGDRFELPLVVQNQTDQPMAVQLAAGASNARFVGSVSGGADGDDPAASGKRQAGVQFSVPPNDRVEVRLPATTVRAGTARFQVAISGRPDAGGKGRGKGAEAVDAASFDLPVWTPATSEAFATYGEIGGLPPEGAPAGGDPGAILQPIRAPQDVWPQFGGLEITTSSTALHALTDAFLYLSVYPYECAEQRASRVLSVAALRDVLDAFDAEGLPSPERIQEAMERDITELGRLQNRDGGWGFWRQDDKSWPYVSLHVAHALARAEAKGYPLPAGTRDRMLGYLRNVEARTPADYPQSAKDALSAYALYVRRLLDDTDGAKAQALLKRAGIADVRKAGLSLEALGWLLPTLYDAGRTDAVDQILAHLNQRITETAATAQFTTGYGEGDWLLLYSDRRTDGVLLEALIEVRPRHDIVPKLVRGLLDHRVAGRWGNTQENAFVLLAMDRYFAVYEAQTPDFVARAWLGETYAGEHRFQGRDTDHVTIDVPMETVVRMAGDEAAPLVLQRDGTGRLYYRIGLRYAPRSLELEPADRGFVVLRSYEAVDDPADVQQLDDGSWRIASGARVRVRLQMVADARRTHVALVDPLPAGLEVINPELAVSEDVPADVNADDSPTSRSPWWWWWRPWYEHENIRDERVEAFSTLLYAGVYEYTYVARATTPGQFVVPPAKAEEMYHPETFGRSGTARVIIE